MRKRDIPWITFSVLVASLRETALPPINKTLEAMCLAKNTLPRCYVSPS